jgi:hypothetical protein
MTTNPRWAWAATPGLESRLHLPRGNFRLNIASPFSVPDRYLRDVVSMETSPESFERFSNQACWPEHLSESVRPWWSHDKRLMERLDNIKMSYHHDPFTWLQRSRKKCLPLRLITF